MGAGREVRKVRKAFSHCQHRAACGATVENRGPAGVHN